MPTRHRSYTLLGIFLITVTSQVIGQNPEESPRAKFQTSVAESLKPIIERLCETAPEKDQIVCKSIEYQVTDYGESTATSPGSRVVNGQRYIEIPLMYVRELLLTNEAQALAIYKYISQEAFQGYLRYVAKTNRENSARKGHDPVEIQSAEEFAKLTPEVRSQIKNDSKVFNGKKNVYESSLAFTLAHEIGHHVFDHNRSDRALKTCSDKKLAQDQERQADAWAIDAVLRIGQPPNGGLLVLYVSLFSNEEDPQAARLGDHPTDAERILTFQKATLNNLDKLTEIMQRNGRSPDEVRQQLQDSIRRYQAKVDQNPAPPCDPPRPKVKPTKKERKVIYEIS